MEASGGACFRRAAGVALLMLGFSPVVTSCSTTTTRLPAHSSVNGPSTSPLAPPIPSGVPSAECGEASRARALPESSRQDILQRVKSLALYHDQVAEEFLNLVAGWTDPCGQPVLLVWKEELEAAGDSGDGGRQVAETRQQIAARLTARVCAELEQIPWSNKKGWHLSQVVRGIERDCIGVAQVLYVLGSHLGLAARVAEMRAGDIPGTAGLATRAAVLNAVEIPVSHHAEVAFELGNGLAVMTSSIDLSNPGVSEPFDFNASFAVKGNYWGLLDRSSPSTLPRRLRLLTHDELVAGLFVEQGVSIKKLASKPGTEPQEAQRQFQLALDSYQKALELDPKSALAWYSKGKAFDATARFAEAILAYEEALARDPELVDAAVNVGTIYFNRHAPGDIDEAVRMFEWVVERSADDADAWERLARSYLARDNPGDKERAVGCLKKVSELARKARQLNE